MSSSRRPSTRSSPLRATATDRSSTPSRSMRKPLGVFRTRKMRIRRPATRGSMPSRRCLPEPVARTFMVPRVPCGAPTTPITTGSERLSTVLVRDLHVDPLPELDGGGLHDRADRPDRAPPSADDLAHVLLRHPELQVHPGVRLGGG